jgi:hypothetical protein
MGLSLPGWPAVGALAKGDRTGARDGFPAEANRSAAAGLLLPIQCDVGRPHRPERCSFRLPAQADAPPTGLQRSMQRGTGAAR